MIESMALVSILGLMEGNMLVSGKTESSMEKEDIDKLMDKKEKVFGKMGKDYNGQMIDEVTILSD